jgi:hypothetical protein
MKFRPVVTIAVAIALGSIALQACANSILRNAAEAGVESVLEGPLPTATAAPPPPTPSQRSAF